MKVTADENMHLTYQSESISTSELSTDLIIVLEKLYSKEIINSKEILFHIDATNGNVFISGFDSQTGHVSNDNGIWVEFHELWDDTENSYDFDEILIESIRKALSTTIGRKVTEQFEIYVQTEMDEAEKIK